jgi:pimeloyl-ACP methyl ester carboxylesterase
MTDSRALLSLASSLDRDPIASGLLRPNWPWALAQRPGVERVELTHGTLRVRTRGVGDRAIVFLIDPPNTVEHYDALLAELTREEAKSSRVVCVELPGFGFSRPGSGFDFGVAGYATVLDELLTELQIESCTLVGACVWAYAALLLAARQPDRVRGLVLTQSPCWADEVSWSRRIDTHGVVRRPVLGQAAMYAARTRVATRWYDSALPVGADRGAFTGPALSALKHGARFALGSLTQAWFGAESPDFSRVFQPTRLLWGNADRSHRRSREGSLGELLPNAERVTFDDCGHFPELEAPLRFCAVLRSLP